jgi:hypothetical protein
MKSLLRNHRQPRPGFLGLVLLSFLFILALAIPTNAQVTPTTPITLTNIPPIIPGGASSNVVQKYDAPLGRGLAIIPAFNLTTAAGTNNVIFTLQVSANGTSWTTSSGLTHTVAGNGTETVRSLWYIPTTSLDGVAYWRLATVNNAANTPPISNLTAVATWRNP